MELFCSSLGRRIDVRRLLEGRQSQWKVKTYSHRR